MPERIAIVLVMVTITTAVYLVFKSMLEHLRGVKTERIRAEMYNRTLDKLGGGQEVLVYLQSESGGKLFQAMQDEPNKPRQPHSRIMNAVQAGVVLAVLGGGFLAVRGYMSDREAQEAFLVMGTIGMFAGLGMVASGVAAWLLAKNFGLLNGSGRQE